MKEKNIQWIAEFPENSEKSISELLEEKYGISLQEEKTNNISHLHSPRLLKDSKKAIERILRAIETQERIIVFGDYDVDGVLGTALLVEALSLCGAQVSYRIPRRDIDGYGIKPYFLDELKTKGVSLIITVDNGIMAHDTGNYAKELGIDLIITDHHTPSPSLPQSYALINPKQEGCEYPNKDICGCALAYKLASEIIRQQKSVDEYEKFLKQSLDLVALATIADCVPLIAENRLLTKLGIEVIRTHPRKGIQELLDILHIEKETVSEETIGFQIAPLINASGRLHSAYFALQLFLNNTQNNAQLLYEMNTIRKELTKETLENIPEEVFSSSLLFVYNPQIKPGIIGLLAGRLTEKHHLPSIVLTEENGNGIASCRAPEWCDIYEFLALFENFFTHFGGHKQAAGFSLPLEKLEPFLQELKQKADKILSPQKKVKTFSYIKKISVKDISFDSIKSIQEFAPFGQKHEKPLFVLENQLITEWKYFGNDKNHLSLFLPVKDGTLRAILFFGEEYREILEKKEPIDLLMSLKFSHWNSLQRLEAEIVDIKKCLI
jgi:single-stranded-DNA-specific exonuclease